jgi:hypothetical protein
MSKIICDGDEFVAVLGAEEPVSGYDTGWVCNGRQMKDSPDGSFFNAQTK